MGVAVNLGQFTQATANLAPTDTVRLGNRADGSTEVVPGRHNLGTKAARWFRDTLNIADPVTRAFKLAVRQAVGGDKQAARTLLHGAGIHQRRPLTKAQIAAVDNALLAGAGPPPNQPPPLLVPQTPVVTQQTVTDPPPKIPAHGGPQREQAARDTSHAKF